MKTILSLLPLALLTSCAASPTWQEMNATRSDIRESIKSANSEINACYDKELVSNPKLTGTLTLDFDIDDQGKILKLSKNAQRSTLSNAVLEECVGKALKAKSYPQAIKGTVTSVSFPFEFNPK